MTLQTQLIFGFRCKVLYVSIIILCLVIIGAIKTLYHKDDQSFKSFSPVLTFHENYSLTENSLHNQLIINQSYDTLFNATLTENSKSNFAVFTFISSVDYLAGALNLGASIHKARQDSSFVIDYVAVIKADKIAISDVCLLRKYWNVIITTPGIRGARDPTFVRFVDQYTKLEFWSYTQYSRIVYFDSDFIILKNFDELFTIEISAMGVVRDFSAGNYKKTFNAGFFVIEPNKDLFYELINHIKSATEAGLYDTEQDE